MVADIVEIDCDRVAFAQTCATCGKHDHGRPYVIVGGRALGDISVSWSHSEGVVAAAVSQTMEVGVDVERLRPMPIEMSEFSSALTSQEECEVRSSSDPDQSFLHVWTVKESLVKVGGFTLDEVVRAHLVKLLSQAPGTKAMTWLDSDSLAVVGLVATPRRDEV